MMLVRQLDAAYHTAFIEELVATADSLKQGGTLCISGTTRIAAAEK
jgi:hypothetical protein